MNPRFDATTLRRLLLAALVVAPAAGAETLAQRDYWAGQMQYTQRKLDELRERCNVEIEFAYDRDAWWAQRDEVAARGASPNGRCEDALNAMLNVCWDDAEGSRRIQEAIRRVECGLGGFDRGFRATLENGTFRYDVEIDRSNPLEALTAFLKEKL